MLVDFDIHNSGLDLMQMNEREYSGEQREGVTQN